MDSFKDVVRPDPQGPIYHKECYRISQKQREMEWERRGGVDREKRYRNCLKNSENNKNDIIVVNN